MTPEGVIHLKTDSQSLFDYTCNVVKVNNLPVFNCTDDLYMSDLPDDILSVRTHYEKIFMDKGFTIKYLTFSIPESITLVEPEKHEQEGF